MLRAFILALALGVICAGGFAAKVWALGEQFNGLATPLIVAFAVAGVVAGFGIGLALIYSKQHSRGRVAAWTRDLTSPDPDD